jgi:hypothetical protein
MAFALNRVPEVRGERQCVGEVKSIAHGMHDWAKKRQAERHAEQ